MACEIEIDRCKEPIGKQDQYAAALGGLNLIRFHENEAVSSEPVICSPEILGELQDSILVFFTGRTRSASNVLAQQSQALRSNETKKIMRRMVELAFEMKAELESGSLHNFGPILDEGWRLKSQLTCGISDRQIDSWYQLGLANGATGGKLLGAGNGGFIMFFADPKFHSKIQKALSDLVITKFRMDNNGTQIVFYQPN